MRLLIVPGLVGALLTGELSAATPTRDQPTSTVRLVAVSAATPSVVVYRPPATPLIVLRGFTPPRSRYGAGHLGVDLRVGAGGVVRSAGLGVVRFAGQVAGRGVVVIAHPDGISTEYEPVRPLVAVGHPVSAGTPVGELLGVHRGCGGRCLHWGARRGETYLDPLGLLRPLGPVGLLPWTASRGS